MLSLEKIVLVVEGPVVICLTPGEVDPEIKRSTNPLRAMSSTQVLERLEAVGGSLG